MLSHNIKEPISAEDGDQRILRSNDAGRTRLVVDSHHLTNEMARFNMSENKFSSRSRNA